MNPTQLARALLWLAILGAVVLFGGRLLSKAAGKAGAAL